MSRGSFYVLFTASGFAGLIYESVWTQYLKLFLGHAAYAQSLVLAVFMGGMAAGAAYCGRWSARLPNPLLIYALIEAVIGLAALVFHAIFVGVTDWSYDYFLPQLGDEWLAFAAKLGVSSLLILPQSILLGMTFPLMSAGLVRAQRAAAGESVAMLYFTNSLGAAAGVLASGFVLIAWVGLPGTLRTAGFLNLLLAIIVWFLARAPIPRGCVLYRARIVHLRDQLDPHALTRARRLDAFVRAHARHLHFRPGPGRARRAPARRRHARAGAPPCLGAAGNGACRGG